MNYNDFKDKLPAFFPWGILFILSISLIVLPAISCSKERADQLKTKKLGKRGKRFVKKQNARNKKKATNTSNEWSILN